MRRCSSGHVRLVFCAGSFRCAGFMTWSEGKAAVATTITAEVVNV